MWKVLFSSFSYVDGGFWLPLSRSFHHHCQSLVVMNSFSYSFLPAGSFKWIIIQCVIPCSHVECGCQDKCGLTRGWSRMEHQQQQQQWQHTKKKGEKKWKKRKHEEKLQTINFKIKICIYVCVCVCVCVWQWRLDDSSIVVPVVARAGLMNAAARCRAFGVDHQNFKMSP